MASRVSMVPTPVLEKNLGSENSGLLKTLLTLMTVKEAVGTPV
jgi:hypothetical protein